MRVYLLLILFFASTASARVRMKRDSSMTTMAPTNTSTDGGNTCTGNGCNHKDSHNPFEITWKLIRAISSSIKDDLLAIFKVINKMNGLVLKVSMSPVELEKKTKAE